MDDRLLEQGRQFSEKRRKRRTWKNIVSVLACVVVFCTTYALILPAITMEKDTYCGHKEHKHSEKCYETELICTLSEEETSTHEHSEECYQKEQVLVCKKEESSGHSHSSECEKIEKERTCGLEESEGHTHSDTCYTEDGTLSCGKEEYAGHTHSDACYTEKVTVVCGKEESEGHAHSDACYDTKKVLKCEKEAGAEETHVHTEECYKEELVCDIKEHEHEKSCYSDKTADVETASDWEKTLPDELTGIWADDVLAVAESQLGYEESTKNFIVTEDDEVKGYSRYGAWYGDPYGHWCAMFVSFCLDYAEVDKDLMPQDANCQNWIETLSKEEYELYHEADDYEPVPGDLIFFNFDEDKASDHIGIVVEIIEETKEQKAQVKTIEGNSIDNNVRYLTYDLDSECIMGYGQLPKNPEKEEEETTEEVTKEVVEEKTTQTITFEDEDGWMKAEATFEEGVLPEDAILTVAFAEENEDEVNAAINDYVNEQEKELLNTFLFTATFTDKDGNALEPNGDIKMKVTFDTPIEMIDAQAMMVSREEEDTPKVTTQWQYYLVDADNTVDGSNEDALHLSESSAVNGFDTIYKNNAVYALAATGEAAEEKVVKKATYAINDAYGPRGITRVGAWGRDVVNIAKSQIGYNEENGVSKFDQWAGSSGYNNWNVNFVNYCLHYADVDVSEIPWDTSYNYNEWQSVLEEAGEYNTYTNGAAKVGDIVFVQGWNPGQEYNVGIIVEESATQYKIVFGDMNGNGRVEEQDFYKDWTQRILGYVSLSNSFKEETDDYVVIVNHNKSDDIKDVVIYFENDNPNAATWTEAVNATHTDPLKSVMRNHYISIELFDSVGKKVIPSGTVVLEIEFKEPLPASLSRDDMDVSIEWAYQLVNNDTEVITPQTEIEIACDGSDAIDGLELTVENAEIYAFTSLQVNNGNRTTYEVYNLNDLENAFNANTTGEIAVVLKNSIDATSLGQSLSVGNGEDIILNLNGHTITADSTLFTVEGGKLTIKDTEATAEETRIVGNVNLSADLAYDTVKGDDMVGRQAVYNSATKELTYYVTTSNIVNQNTGATNEQLVEHKVTLRGTISATAGTSPLVEVKSGRLNMNSGAIVDCKTSAITQSGGKIYLKGGYICGNSTSGSGGAIYSQGSGSIYQSGSVLAANTAGVDGGAISIDGKALTISGGVISGNICQAEGKGSGGGVFAKGSTGVKVTGGYITNNRTNSEAYKAGGGGIYCTNQSTLYLRGGYITGNYAGGGGGGVRTCAGEMYMSGSIVSSNFAETAEGGGITVDEPCIANITGGYINNNISNTYEHWGGGGLFCANGSTLYIRCVLVTENKAGGYGGGVAGCSTGRTFICEHNGGAIFDNEASEPGQSNLSGGISTKNEDHEYASQMFQQYGYDDFFSAFNSVVGGTMLGGQPAYWTGSVDGVPVEADADDTLVSSYLMGLTAHPTETGKQVAYEESRVFINGNDSFTHGGGILCNGYMVIGDVTDVEVFARLEVFAEKTLLDASGNKAELQDGQFEFEIVSKDTGRVVATGTNDEFGKVTFDHMIPFTEAGVYVYHIYEKAKEEHGGILMDSTDYEITVTVKRTEQGMLSEHIAKYRYEVTHLKVEKITLDGRSVLYEGDPKDRDQYSIQLGNVIGDDVVNVPIKFNNIQSEETNISVIKNWVGEQPENNTVIQVQLYRNGEAYGNPVTLSASNNWSYEWGKLPLNEVVNGEEVHYTYTVKELNIPSGYQVEYNEYVTSDSKEIWVPASGNTLINNQNYIIVSPNEDYVLYPPRNTSVESDSVASITKHNGEILSTSIPSRSVYTALTKGKNWGELMLKNPGMEYLELYVSDGKLATAWTVNTNLYVGNTRINYDENSSTSYAIVFENGRFSITSRNNANSWNSAKLYVPKTVLGDTEILFSITNKKVEEEDIRYKLDITKVSASDNNIRLAGAHFELYRADENGEIVLEDGKPVAVTFVKATAGKYEYCEPNVDGATKDIVSDTVTTFGGKLILSELPAGNYVLRETLAPNGYEAIKDQKITLGDVSQPTIELFLEDEKTKEEVYELPETGGPGTNAYTAGGILLLMISVLLYIKRKNQMKGGQVSN